MSLRVLSIPTLTGRHPISIAYRHLWNTRRSMAELNYSALNMCLTTAGKLKS